MHPTEQEKFDLTEAIIEDLVYHMESITERQRRDYVLRLREIWQEDVLGRLIAATTGRDTE